MATIREVSINEVRQEGSEVSQRTLSRRNSLLRRSSQMFKLDFKKPQTAPAAGGEHLTKSKEAKEARRKSSKRSAKKRQRPDDSPRENEQPKPKKIKKSRSATTTQSKRSSSSSSMMENVAKLVRRKPSQLKIKRSGSLVQAIPEGAVSPVTSPRGTPRSPRFNKLKMNVRRMSKSLSFPPLREKEEQWDFIGAQPLESFAFTAQIDLSQNKPISLLTMEEDGWMREGAPMELSLLSSPKSPRLLPASSLASLVKEAGSEVELVETNGDVAMSEVSAEVDADAETGTEIGADVDAGLSESEHDDKLHLVDGPQLEQSNDRSVDSADAAEIEEELSLEEADVVMGDRPSTNEIVCDVDAQRFKWFSQHFMGRELRHFVGTDAVRDSPVLITILDKSSQVWVLVHTKDGVSREVGIMREEALDKEVCTLDKKWIKEVLLPSSLAIHSLSGLREIIDHKKEVEECLLKMEKQEEPEQLKFGVLNVQPGQTEEAAMFMNAGGSEAYEHFLAAIGEKVQLKGWEYFNGGLDCERDLTGTHSVFSRYGGYEVMFHVSTMIPTDAEDEQNLGKKRHLGNDIVVVVFLDGERKDITPYSPNTVRTHFNHVLCVVAPDGKDAEGEWTYTVQFARKETVRGFQPPLPPVTHHVKAAHLRPFLLCKLINAEHAAYQSPTFLEKLIFTRKALLQNFTQYD
eukprot:TRINITY_DN3725_c0_g1_i1.p1 TRINITY_DN3725_c0_g1~~TRINITY_DN3725_c0_g1_i1.p1  ORF type:complete len:700 (-),score=118.95 TRINITY_DN3725_c0_g1_i1:159-2222(-)